MTIINSIDSGLIFQKLKSILNDDYEKYEIISYHSVDKLIDYLHAKSMFDIIEKRYIFTGCTFLIDEKEISTCETLFKVLKMNHELDIFLTVEADKILIKHPMIKELFGFVKFINIPKLTNYNMQNIIITILKEKKVHLSQKNINKLLSCLIPNALIIENEINKLKFFKSSELTDELIDDLIFEYNNDSVFKLVEYILNKQISLAIKLFHNLIPQLYSPIEILQIMSAQVLKLILFTLAVNQKMSDNDIMQQLGLNFFQFNQNKKICSMTNMKSLTKFLNDILTLDKKIKKYDMNGKNNLLLFISKKII